MWKVTYKSEVVTTNKVIRPDRCSCIFFQNEGDNDVLINNNISLKAFTDARSFENRPDEIIDCDFSVTFPNGASQVLIVKTYYIKE